MVGRTNGGNKYITQDNIIYIHKKDYDELVESIEYSMRLITSQPEMVSADDFRTKTNKSFRIK